MAHQETDDSAIRASSSGSGRSRQLLSLEQVAHQQEPSSPKDKKDLSSLSETEYRKAINDIREEMLAISRNPRFVRSRGMMTTDKNGKILATEEKADKNVLNRIETVRKKIYDIAKKYNKPPREVLQKSQTLAKESLDRDKLFDSNSSNARYPSSSKNNSRETDHDDVVIIGEMIGLKDDKPSAKSVAMPKSSLLNSISSKSCLETERSVSYSPGSQLSNIDKIIEVIDSKISALRTCIADIQMGSSVDKASSLHLLNKDMVWYEVKHELTLANLSLGEFQKLQLKPLRCLQYPVRLQEPDYWTRLQSAVLTAAKKPLETCLETAEQHKIGLFHLLAALKEGFKKGRGRIEKECQTPTQHPLSPSGSKTPMQILPNDEQKQREPPTVAVKPLLVSNDKPGDTLQNRKRDLSDISSDMKDGKVQKHASTVSNPNTNKKKHLSTSTAGFEPDASGQSFEAMKDARKEDSDDEVVLVEEKPCLDKKFDKEVSKQQESNKLDTKPSQMVCNTCHTSFRKPRDYHSHVLAVCLDYDVL